MDRYEQVDVSETGRSTKNQDLYKNIYQEGEYSNIEGIASISKNNEIDLGKLKEMLKKREVEPVEKKYRTTKIPIIEEEEADAIYADKNYDIRKILDKAKTESTNDTRYHSLKEVDFDFLKSLNLKDLRSLKEDPDTTDELKELINTITSTSILNQLGDKELSLDMLSELKPTGSTLLDTKKTLKNLIAGELQNTKSHKESAMDQTFFTTNHNFKAEDFESLEDMKTSIKKNNKMIRILVYFLIVIVVIVVFYFIVKLWK